MAFEFAARDAVQSQGTRETDSVHANTSQQFQKGSAPMDGATLRYVLHPLERCHKTHLHMVQVPSALPMFARKTWANAVRV